ncbi:hypothetical protein PM082_004672 [Marasmius tenuissimus]|nr:hypothetical protein PM082_004672 [Marasmius tenuissimus]
MNDIRHTKLVGTLDLGEPDPQDFDKLINLKKFTVLTNDHCSVCSDVKESKEDMDTDDSDDGYVAVPDLSTDYDYELPGPSKPDI